MYKHTRAGDPSKDQRRDEARASNPMSSSGTAETTTCALSKRPCCADVGLGGSSLLASAIQVCSRRGTLQRSRLFWWRIRVEKGRARDVRDCSASGGLPLEGPATGGRLSTILDLDGRARARESCSGVPNTRSKARITTTTFRNAHLLKNIPSHTHISSENYAQAD